MSDNHTNKHKHLEFVTNSIGRMAHNSTLYKGWAITIFSIIGAVAVDKDKYQLFYLGLLPVIGFYIADVYYLWLEQVFRELYKNVCNIDEEYIDYSMNIDKYKKSCSVVKALFSKSQLFYLVLLLISISVPYFTK